MTMQTFLWTKTIQFTSEQRDKSSPLNFTQYAVFYPQNGDRTVTIDFVTSLHPMY